MKHDNRVLLILCLLCQKGVAHSRSSGSITDLSGTLRIIRESYRFFEWFKEKILLTCLPFDITGVCGGIGVCGEIERCDDP